MSFNSLGENLTDCCIISGIFEIISFGCDRYFQFTLIYKKPDTYYLNWRVFQIGVGTKKNQQEPILFSTGTDWLIKMCQSAAYSLL